MAWLGRPSRRGGGLEGAKSARTGDVGLLPRLVDEIINTRRPQHFGNTRTDDARHAVRFRIGRSLAEGLPCGLLHAIGGHGGPVITVDPANHGRQPAGGRRAYGGTAQYQSGNVQHVA